VGSVIMLISIPHCIMVFLYEACDQLIASLSVLVLMKFS